MQYWKSFDYDTINYDYITDNKGVTYCNDILTFDIETSSAFFIKNKWRKFYYSLPKEYYNKNTPMTSWCYIWQFGINDKVVFGRTLEEFKEFFDGLMEKVGNKLIVYVHNLAYEMQYLLNIYNIKNVFARKKFKPIKFEIKNSVWKCSYFLSRLSLENIGNKVNTQYKKLKGNLRYDLLRFSDTMLTKRELDYCENDCLVLYEYLLNMKKKYGNLLRIPLTQTGKVRKRLQRLYKDDYRYHNYCKSKVPNLEEYFLLRECFTGGLSRANATWTGVFLDNVRSKDETSAYPFAMLSEEYPCTHFMKTRYTGLLKYQEMPGIKEHETFIVRVRIHGLKSKSWLKYISSNKVNSSSNKLCDNGRIVKADWIDITVNKIQLELINNLYRYESIEFKELWVAKTRLLDKKYRDLIIELFNEKNRLKFDKSMKAIYQELKEELNSLYGMMVTNLILPDIIFENNKWDIDDDLNDAKINAILDKQRNSRSTLTIYSNGVYVTSYAQKYLVDMALLIGEDTVYMDTDSLKYLNGDSHEEAFTIYNNSVKDKLEVIYTQEEMKALTYIDNGVEYTIGMFTPDGEYDRFVTYGAKKYGYELVVTDSFGQPKKEVHLTVSGLNRNAGNNLNSLDEFILEKVFGYKESGRTIMYYNDNQPKAIIRGHSINYRYGICACNTTYSLKLSPEYERYIEECMLEHEQYDWLNNRKEFLNHVNTSKR